MWEKATILRDHPFEKRPRQANETNQTKSSAVLRAGPRLRPFFNVRGAAECFSMTYAEQLKDPRWQRKRLEIFERDQWQCRECGDHSEQLHVHHRFYRSRTYLWDYPNVALVTFCKTCHDEATVWLQEFDETFKVAFKPRYLKNLCDAFLLSHETSSIAKGMAIAELLGDREFIQYLARRRMDRIRETDPDNALTLSLLIDSQRNGSKP